MILDVLGRVSGTVNPVTGVVAPQDLSGTGPILGSFLSSHTIDLTQSGNALRFRDVGKGNRIALAVRIETAFVSAGATEMGITIGLADAPDGIDFFLTNTVFLTKWVPLNSQLATVGELFIIPVPNIPKAMLEGPGAGTQGRRYLAVSYSPIGGTYSAGAVTAHFGNWADVPKQSVRLVYGYTGP